MYWSSSLVVLFSLLFLAAPLLCLADDHTASSSSTGTSIISDVASAYSQVYFPDGSVAVSVEFEEVNGTNGTVVRITATPNTITPGTYAMHVHINGDLTGAFAASPSVGTHFDAHNPYGPHGCYPDQNRHTGDIGDLTFDSTSSPVIIERDLIRLIPSSSSSIIGRALVLHQHNSSCVIQPTGGAGSIIAAGVIGIAYIPAGTPASPAPNQLAGIALSSPPTAAVAVFHGLGAPTDPYAKINGSIWFIPQTDGTIRVIATLMNLPSNHLTLALHGFHIHQYGQDSDPAGVTAGSHFNSNDGEHNYPMNITRHFGDLGNGNEDASGVFTYDLTITNLITPDSLTQVLGRSVVLHNLTDDGINTASAGLRIAQGIIGLSASLPPGYVPPNAGNASSGTRTLVEIQIAVFVVIVALKSTFDSFVRFC